VSADCIFCRIVRGDAPCHRICEDASTFAFLDLFPASRGHALVVPRAHFESLFELDAGTQAAVAETARRLARALRKALEPDGLGVHQLNGAAAGQTVFHHHVHLIPRREGEPFALHGRRQGDAAELARTAAAIAAALEP
jgi:histidine triad (HIT) family protein